MTMDVHSFFHGYCCLLEGNRIVESCWCPCRCKAPHAASTQQPNLSQQGWSLVPERKSHTFSHPFCHVSHVSKASLVLDLTIRSNPSETMIPVVAMVNSLLEGKPWLRPSFFPASRARLAASEAICWASFSDRGRTQDVGKKGSKIRKDVSSTAKWVYNHEQNKGLLLQQHKNKVKWKLKQQKWEVHRNEKLLKKYFFWWEKIGNGLVKMSTKDGMAWWTDFSAAIQHSTLSFFQCRYKHTDLAGKTETFHTYPDC